MTFCVRPEVIIMQTSLPEGRKRNVFKGEIVKVFDRGLMYQTNTKIDDDFFNLTQMIESLTE